MNKKLSRALPPFLGGLVLGILLTGGFFCMRPFPAGNPLAVTAPNVSSASAASISSSIPVSQADSDAPAETASRKSVSAPDKGEPSSWEPSAVYTGGDTVLYNNRIFRAKWWTQGEEPGTADVWADTREALSPPEPAPAPSSSPPSVKKKGDFRVVGYYPSWKPEELGKLRYDVLTHVVYAFAIPTPEGGLRPLENASTAEQILADAHANGVKVLLAVGGWSYNDVPLEPAFVQATETEEKCRAFGGAILAMCDQYGFDGVDMDWEHPRVDGGSGKQYEALMLYLAQELHTRGKVLTSAVLSGATPDGNIYYDAAAHSDSVLEAVDWIHVMAYDGGDGERHSSYEFAVGSGSYWQRTRGMPGDKVVLGVPFYGRPSWASYEDILAANAAAWETDRSPINGMEASYNGVNTILKKTRYAKENLGGVMIWEVTQDTSDIDKSLMTAIGRALE